MSHTSSRGALLLAPRIASALAALPALVAAQEVASSPAGQPPILPTVVIKAQRAPDRSTLTQPDLPTARARIERTPGGAGVLDAASYAEGRVSTLADALGQATGVYVQPRFGAEEARISIRGSGLQRTFHGRGLKLMQDGVPLNLADGSFDFQAVEALSARYVEVWRGANALQYGASTLGGAVNFVSPNGYNADKARARLEAGSFGYRRAHVSTGGVSDRFDHYLSASTFRQDGFRDHAEQDTRRLFANLGWQLSPTLETRVYLGHVHSDSALPGALTRAQLEADARQANPGSISGDQRRDIRWTRVSSKTVYRHGSHQAELFLYASDKSLFHPIFQVLEQDNRDRGAELRYVHEAELSGHANRLTIGISPSEGRTWEDRFGNVAGRPGARTNRTRHTARNLELYAENQFSLRPGLTLVTGVQHAQARRALDDRFIAGTGSDTVSEGFRRRYRATSPKLGVVHEWQPGLQWFANWSRSFEPPTFSELAGGLRPVLNEAQTAGTLEVGTRGRTGRVVWDVAFYESRLKDELLMISTAPSITTAVNAGRTRHRGLELGLSGQGDPTGSGRLEWRLHALWNDFRFRGDPVYDDNRLPGLPSRFARAQVGWRLPGGTLLAVQLEAASDQVVDFTNSLRAPGYGLWGLKASGEWRDGLSWFVDGRNLSDRRYAGTTGIVRDARGQDVPQFLPGDGRAVYIGLDLRFN